MVMKFRVVVLQEFLAYAEKSSVIDMGTLRGIADSFTDEHPGDDDLVIDLSPPVAKKRGRKKKKEEDTCDFCRMPEINEEKCMGRCFAKGRGFQCSRKRLSDTEYCKMHAQNDHPVLGRIDEPRRLKKYGSDAACGWRWFVDGGDGIEVVLPAPVEDDAHSLVEEADIVLDEEEPAIVVQEAVALEVEEAPALEVEEAPAHVEEVVALEVEEAPAIEVEEAPAHVEEVVALEVEEAPALEVEEAPAHVEEVVAIDVEAAALAEQEAAVIEDNEIKMASYQGVGYRFISIGDGTYQVEFVDQRSLKIRVVGKYDDEDMIFINEWQATHDTKITDEDDCEIVFD